MTFDERVVVHRVLHVPATRSSKIFYRWMCCIVNSLLVGVLHFTIDGCIGVSRSRCALEFRERFPPPHPCAAAASGERTIAPLFSYRGISLIGKNPPPGPPQGPRHSRTVGSSKEAVPYERGTPISRANYATHCEEHTFMDIWAET